MLSVIHLSSLSPSSLVSTGRDVYTRRMLTFYQRWRFTVKGRTATAALLLVPLIFFLLPSISAADPDVYKALPSDVRVLQYNIEDHDGDGQKELAVLYESGGRSRLTLFKGDAGRWTRWWDDKGSIARPDGIEASFLESADINGDGKSEILTYYLTEKHTAMTARILAYESENGLTPSFKIILEDTTSPPGYPLLGMEEGSYSVTFMRMATKKGSGYRRVYCWSGEKFEKCREVVWEKP